MDRAIAVVTGASHGLGKATALRFAAGGHHVVIGARDRDDLNAVERSIEESDGNATAIRTDVRDEFDLERLMETAAQIGGSVDVLVANAAANHGSNDEQPFANESYSQFDDHLRTNTRGTFATITEALPHLAPDARILVVSCTGPDRRPRGSFGVSKTAAESVALRFSDQIRQTIGVVYPGSVGRSDGAGRSFDPDTAANRLYRVATELDPNRLDGNRLSLQDFAPED